MTDVARKLTESRWFKGTVLGTIVFSGVLVGVETVPALRAAHGGLLGTLDALVLGVFIIEAALKILACGARPWDYFRNGWNVFDFMVIVVCLLPAGAQFAVILRLGRTIRLLRLVSALPRLQILVGALFKSLGSMGYVGLLLGILFYIYAVAGVHLFGRHDPQHFGNLGAAFLTLFQTVTLDDWKELYSRASAASAPAAGVYFVSFILLGTMIMLNLFIGIIMNSMSEMHAELDAAASPGENAGVRAELDALQADLDAMRARIGKLRSGLGGHDG